MPIETLWDSSQAWSWVRFVLAALLGGVIGLERETQAKPAGLRTNMLVAGASALLVSVGLHLVETFEEKDVTGAVHTDPLRVMEAVVTGVSFLGAGTIIRAGRQGVAGLTTAASVLLAAAIGIAVGAEQYGLAVAVTFTALIILRGFGALSSAIDARSREHDG